MLSIFWVIQVAHAAWAHKVSTPLHPVWLFPECLPLIPVWRGRMGPVEVTQSQCNSSASMALPVSLSSLSSTHGVCTASGQSIPSPNSLLFPLLCPPCWERVWAASPRVTLAVSQLCFSSSGDLPSSFTGCLPGIHNCSHRSHFGKNISRDFTLFCQKTGTNIINPSAGMNPSGLAPGRCRSTLCSPDDLPLVHENFQLNPAQLVFWLTL